MKHRSRRKAKSSWDEPRMFDPGPPPPPPDDADEDESILWIPPRLVHAAARDAVARFIAGTRIDEDDTSKRTVLRFTGRRRGFVRVRDAQRLRGHPERLYQVTIRRRTPKARADASEWAAMQRGDFDLFATLWVDAEAEPGESSPTITDLHVRSCVVVDVANLVRDMRERPACMVAHPETKRLLFRAPGGAMFSAVDIRRVAPDTRVLVYGIEGEASWAPAELAEQGAMW